MALSATRPGFEISSEEEREGVGGRDVREWQVACLLSSRMREGKEIQLKLSSFLPSVLLPNHSPFPVQVVGPERLSTSEPHPLVPPRPGAGERRREEGGREDTTASGVGAAVRSAHRGSRGGGRYVYGGEECGRVVGGGRGSHLTLFNYSSSSFSPSLPWPSGRSPCAHGPASGCPRHDHALY